MWLKVNKKKIIIRVGIYQGTRYIKTESFGDLTFKEGRQIMKKYIFWVYGGPEARTLCSQYRVSGFNPWSGNKIPHNTLSV